MRHVTEELAAYCLGALEEEEARVVARHLAGCQACRGELASYQMAADELASSVPAYAPPPELKGRLMARIRKNPPIPASTVTWGDRLWRWLQTPTPAWQLGLVSALLVIVIVGFVLADSGGREPFGQIALAATENAPRATGILIISADGEYGSLVVQGLPDLNPGQQYQLWLIDNGRRASGGVFSVHEGYAAMQVYAPRALDSYEAFGITIEPAGGSPGPTGAKVLGSS